jgi:hypothetical protein
MKILDLYPKDVCATIELSMREIGKILLALGKAQLKYDGKNPQEIEAVEFLKGPFFQTLDRLYEENKQHGS